MCFLQVGSLLIVQCSLRIDQCVNWLTELLTGQFASKPIRGQLSRRPVYLTRRQRILKNHGKTTLYLYTNLILILTILNIDSEQNRLNKFTEIRLKRNYYSKFSIKHFGELASWRDDSPRLDWLRVGCRQIFCLSLNSTSCVTSCHATRTTCRACRVRRNVRSRRACSNMVHNEEAEVLACTR